MLRRLRFRFVVEEGMILFLLKGDRVEGEVRAWGYLGGSFRG